MLYSDIKKTENTDSMHLFWSEYRSSLTKYIAEGLRENCSKDSWVAIWGAGGCNDIDIGYLAKDYRLLLIDHELSVLESARRKYGLERDRCKIADVGFWSITDSDYEMLQALLMDGASNEKIISYLDELVNKMPEPVNLERYGVSCSVVVGLASQLNARIAAMLHLSRNKIELCNGANIIRTLNSMTKKAVERLFIAVRQLTTNLIITGYECEVFYDLVDAQNYCMEIEEVFELISNANLKQSFLSGKESTYVNIAGSDIWHMLLYKALMMGKLEDVGRCRTFTWQFSQEKCYSMLTETFEIV